MDEKIEKLVARLTELAEKYDENALVDGLLELVKRADKALEDGRLSIFELMRLGGYLLEVLRSAKRG